MEITVLHNCATIIKSGADALAIDVFSKGIYPFDGISEHDYMLAIDKQGIFKDVKGVLYTHTHPDHYDSELNGNYVNKYFIPEFIPNTNLGKYGSFHIGCFNIKYFKIPHSGKEYQDVIHYVLLISAEGKNIYIAGDADFNSDEHLEFLKDIKIDAAFFNPFYLTAQIPIIELISPKEAYIYHIPKEDDGEKIRQMAINAYKHYSKIGGSCKLISSYPYNIKI